MLCPPFYFVIGVNICCPQTSEGCCSEPPLMLPPANNVFSPASGVHYKIWWYVLNVMLLLLLLMLLEVVAFDAFWVKLIEWDIAVLLVLYLFTDLSVAALRLPHFCSCSRWWDDLCDLCVRVGMLLLVVVGFRSCDEVVWRNVLSEVHGGSLSIEKRRWRPI